MKITPIMMHNYRAQNTPKHLQNKPTELPPPQIMHSPSTAYANYMTFTGGYSINLARTVENLDKLATKDSSIYPPQIREWAGLVLEEGNKLNETLINIHKKFYASIKECFSLDEVKAKFPEFKDVLSDGEVKYAKGSLLDEVKQGKLEHFDNEEDLSLQLLKLYWGEGFSTNDIKMYTGGKDVYATMKKLQIPTMHRDYGHVLKFSDPEYNERIVREMTEKRLAALDRLAQKETGEPVYIPRGPLSDLHKQRISEGLHKFYEENPERLLYMSERQIEFYKNNPEKAFFMKKVMEKAWEVRNADNIKKALSQFMKSNGVKDFQLSDLAEISEKTLNRSKLMKKFWGQNEWAKKAFSKNLTYAWKKCKDESTVEYVMHSVPAKMEAQYKAWLKANGKDEALGDVTTKYNPFYEKSHIIDENNRVFTDEFMDTIHDVANVMADTYQMSVLNLAASFKDMKNLKKMPKSYQDIASLTAYIISKNKTPKGYACQTTEEARKDFMTLYQLAADTHCTEFLPVFEKALDDAYIFMEDMHKQKHYFMGVLK